MGVSMRANVYRRTVKIGYWFDTGQYCIHTVSSPVPIHTRYCPVLYLYWVVMDCTVFVSDLYCIPDDDTKTVLLSTVFLQLISSSTVFVSAFYCIPKTCTNTVLSSTVFIPAIRYPVSVYGTGWYRNDVQNGTVWYLSNTVYREYGIGTVPISTVQQYWNGTVQYRNVYWVDYRYMFYLLMTQHVKCNSLGGELGGRWHDPDQCSPARCRVLPWRRLAEKGSPHSRKIFSKGIENTQHNLFPRLVGI